MRLFKHRIIILSGLLTLIFPVILQAQTANRDSAIEKNWYRSYTINSSPNGEWVHYMNYFMDESSLGYVTNVQTSQTYSFSEGNWGQFSQNSKWFAMPIASNSIELVNLENGNKETLSNVKISDFSYSGDFLITQSLGDTLTIRSLVKKAVYKIGKISSYELNPEMDIIALSLINDNNDSLNIINLKSLVTSLVMTGNNFNFQRMEWSSNGEHLGFIYEKNEENIFHIGMFNLNKKIIQNLDNVTISNKKVKISNSPISVSNSGNKLYFEMVPVQTSLTENSNPEVWDTYDKIIYPRKTFVSSGKEGPWQYVWLLNENKTVSIGDYAMPQVVFNPESDYALVFDMYAKEPQFRYDTFSDIYALNIRSGDRELVVSNQFLAYNYVHLSPDGNFFAYFKDNQWWLYDLKEKRHSNISIDIPHHLFNNKSTRADYPEPYGIAGWSLNGNSLFINDKFDLWKISLDGKHNERLTNGRETKTVFRLVPGKNDKKTEYGNLRFNTYGIDDANGILLSSKNRHTLEMGYYKLYNNRLDQITWRNKRLTELMQMDNENIIFSQESMTDPISIEYVNMKTKESKTIFKGNPEWNQFKWPKRELFYYDIEEVDSIKGVLIYPINYDSSKNYPMVVSTYTEQSFLYHEFSPPFEYNEIGFSYLNYALDDYFVLLPDISYEYNAPGISAAICIEEAVETVLNKASIDRTKIGLIGHSHGGYDAALTITQTDIFTAAVVGSGIYNLESFYFDIYKLAGLPEIARVEGGIWPMKDSYFVNKEAYRANSPLHQAATINTPILIWTGKEDTNVNPNQSLELYLALRRLKKPAKLIYYEGEGHVLNNIENKKDLTQRIKAWFDFYLKSK